jgi:small-conductance mechanosensitive channel
MMLGDLINLNSTINEVSANAESITSDFTWGDVVFVLILLASAYILGLVAAHFMKLRLSHKLKKEQLDLASKLVRVIIVFIAIAFALPGLFNLSMTLVFLIVLACIVVIAMSSSSVVGNAAAGVGLLYEHTFGPGDFIEVNNVSGTVVAVNILSVIIRTTSGVLIRIPNNLLYSNTLSNFYAHVARRYSYEIGIRYEDDSGLAISIIAKILEAHPFVLKNPAPEVFVSNIDPCSIRIKCRFWVPSVWANTEDDLSLQTDFLPKFKSALEAAGLEIPFPLTTIQLTGPDNRD